MNTHKTTIHIRCPYAPVWDYYSVTVRTATHLKCETLQEVCDEIRGQTMTQEAAAKHIKDRLGHNCEVTVKGRHGAEGRLVVTL